jgi:hypothetical protein
MATDVSAREREQKELDWLLTSGVLGRAHNHLRMLKYICEKHFEGEAVQITEHTVAVEALGRRSDFDSQTDTIVRVTTHTLRKRLQEIYQGEGAGHAVHVLIPPGQYAPSFEHVDVVVGTASAQAGKEVSRSKRISALVLARARWWWIAAILLFAGILVGAAYLLQRHVARTEPAMASTPAKLQPPVVTGHPVRALLGEGRKPYVDHSGYTWAPGNYCHGGTSVAEPMQDIVGTEDPYIYLGGVRGNAHCIFPVEPGIYEVHLLFAELSHLEEATSRVVVFLNGSDGNTIDVVDDAGGDYVAATKVFTGVRPQNDGAVHIDFVGEVSLLKAVEILPAPTEAMLPVRVVAGPAAYKDPQGDIWQSDRYFIGGRIGVQPQGHKTGEPSLYSDHRIGHFRYVVPVIPLGKYRVKLYFQEPWFGKQNGGSGGPNSRVFDVWCNGNVLLKSFDIMNEAGAAPVVKTFDNVQATSNGKIELSFVPVVNYALIDAIEVTPETAK